jgi:Sec-independent protein translocase protein TatA
MDHHSCDCYFGFWGWPHWKIGRQLGSGIRAFRDGLKTDEPQDDVEEEFEEEAAEEKPKKKKKKKKAKKESEE